PEGGGKEQPIQETGALTPFQAGDGLGGTDSDDRNSAHRQPTFQHIWIGAEGVGSAARAGGAAHSVNRLWPDKPAAVGRRLNIDSSRGRVHVFLRALVELA